MLLSKGYRNFTSSNSVREKSDKILTKAIILFVAVLFSSAAIN